MFLEEYFIGQSLKNEIQKNAEEIVSFLAAETGERTLRRYASLNSARQYIKNGFLNYGAAVHEEAYEVEGREVANIIAEIPGTENPEKIVLIGAHYDTVENSPGADDNATSIAALLEICRLASELKFRKTLRLVAFTLEEPPYFRSPQMGSAVNAAACAERGDMIELMICLEMLGYGGRRVKQDYPLIHHCSEKPKFGDFLSVISLPSMSEFVHLWASEYNRVSDDNIYKMMAPASVPGMDLSDHSSFISAGYPAIMISNTGFYRNKNYHTEFDTVDRLNFRFLTDNIFNIFRAVIELLNREIPAYCRTEDE